MLDSRSRLPKISRIFSIATPRLFVVIEAIQLAYFKRSTAGDNFSMKSLWLDFLMKQKASCMYSISPKYAEFYWHRY